MNRGGIIIVGLGVIILVLAGVLLLWQKPNVAKAPSNDAIGLVVGANALYAAEQLPGSRVKASIVRLEKPGFLVIHQDNSGEPGSIIGARALLPAGENKNVAAVLSQATQDGQTVFAMIHLDDGDESFNLANDKPAIDPVGNEPVMMMVQISNEAQETGEINL